MHGANPPTVVRPRKFQAFEAPACPLAVEHAIHACRLSKSGLDPSHARHLPNGTGLKCLTPNLRSNLGPGLAMERLKLIICVQIWALAWQWNARITLCNVCAGIPLLAAAFISSHTWRLVSLCIASTVALASFGVVGAVCGGANIWKGGARVILGGWLAMAITYGVGYGIGQGHSVV